MKKTLLLFSFLGLLSSVVLAQENNIVEVKIEGLKKTKKSFLINYLETKSKTPLDSVIIQKDVQRLIRLPAISHAVFSIQQISETECSVVFTVEENRTIIPVVNFWTTTNKEFAYKVGVYDFNFLGKNITMGGFYQNNGYNSYGLTFKSPYLFSNKLGMSVNHQNWTSEEPLYFDNGSALYKYNNISLELMGLYEINFRHNVEFGVNFFKEKYNYKSGLTGVGIPIELDVNKLLFKFVHQYNNLSYHYQYISGFKNEFYAQAVTSKNKHQDEFFIAWNDLFYFRRIGDKGNWANRLRVGLSSNKKSPFAPFALDNNVNLRGVGILVDRGTGSIVYNTEYRHTLYEKSWFVLQGNAFVDAGSWRNPGGNLDDFFKEKNVKVYSGFGLRFINKKVFNAIFRIDYGFGLTKDSAKGLVFGIGQYF